MSKYNEKIYPVEQLKPLLTKINHRHYSDLPKFIFLCGADEQNANGNRTKIKNFFSRTRKDIICVFVEEVFHSDVKQDIDLLQFEKQLAELCDGIVLIVESPGSICELGVFTAIKPIAKKLVVINDSRYKNKNSFINNGPIRYIKEINENMNKIYHLDLANILDDELKIVLSQIAKNKTCYINRTANEVKMNSFIFEILELIYIFGPLPRRDLYNIYNDLKGFPHFDFISGDNKKTIRTNPNHILYILNKANLVTLDNECVDISSTYKPTPFMFKLKESQLKVLRLRMMSKKFRYKVV